MLSARIHSITVGQHNVFQAETAGIFQASEQKAAAIIITAAHNEPWISLTFIRGCSLHEHTFR